MGRRPTIADLARAAGVSVATVDRVLNGRLPVREQTARRVQEAAGAIGFHAAGLIAQRVRRDLPEYGLGFLLLSPETYFYQEFARQIALAAEEATQFRAVPVIDHWSARAPDEVVARLDALAARTQAVAVVSHDHPAVTAAVERLKASGIPIFSLLSDFAPSLRESYVGVDNRKVGRTAAWTIARCAKRPGKVAVFVGSHSFHGHELREIGLRSYFREHAPQFTVLETLVNLETAELTHQAMLGLLDRHPDLVGCYVAGGGMEGAITAMRSTRPAEPPVMICNEITPDSRAALADGILTMVISTPLVPLARELVTLMGRTIRDGPAGTPGHVFLPFDIFVPENI